MLDIKNNLFVFLFSVVLLAGCASSGTGTSALKQETTQTLATKLKKQKSTIDDVAKLYGEPAKVFKGKRGSQVYIYEYKETKGGQLTIAKVNNMYNAANELKDSAQGISNAAQGIGNSVEAAGKKRSRYNADNLETNTNALGTHLDNSQKNLKMLSSGGEDGTGEVTIYKVLRVTFNAKGVVTNYSLK